MAGDLYKLYKDVPFQEVFIRIHNTYIIYIILCAYGLFREAPCTLTLFFFCMFKCGNQECKLLKNRVAVVVVWWFLSKFELFCFILVLNLTLLYSLNRNEQLM